MLQCKNKSCWDRPGLELDSFMLRATDAVVRYPLKPYSESENEERRR